MRMWLIPPRLLCLKHLLGEHVELHMLVATIEKRKCSLQGYVDNKLIDTSKIQERHEELVAEMLRRGYNHKSPLHYEDKLGVGIGIIKLEESLAELTRRCSACRQLVIDNKEPAFTI